MRKLALTSLLALGVAIVLGAQEKEAAFEVASVKLNKSGDNNGLLRALPGGRVQATNMTVRPIITFAYQLAAFQLVGGPAWLTTDRYDLIAKMENTADATPAVPGANAPSPMQHALRNLLEERFKLRVRRESREMDIYVLVMARPGGGPGPNLKPTTQDCAAVSAAANRGEPPPKPPPGQVLCGIQGGPGRLRFGGLPAVSLAQAFAGPAGRMVVDRTGLTGSWDFELNYAAEGRGGADALSVDPNAPSFFTAIQEQLGLKLEPTKGPVDVLVIDSIEKPVED
jgi:uncharacterized protein (TIGR03435 family)